jgi:hypothetical protein
MRRLEYMTEPELRELMNTMGGGIDFMAQELGVEKPLFVLLLFNDPKIAQFMSSCDRSTMVEALRETADRLERKETVDR